jgi:hypothetical protein
MKNLVILSAIAVALGSCAGSASKTETKSGNASGSDSSTTYVVPPCQNAKLNTEAIAFLNEAGSVSKTTRGTMVIVPENAFVYEDGTPVKGEVKVDIKEIFTPAEIILSGIPMNVEHNGKIEPFISDGMFDIRASAQNKAVKIAEGKSITVCNESNKENTDFDYWYFDEKSGQWDNLGNRGQTSTMNEVQQMAEETNPVKTKEYVSFQAVQNPSIKSIQAAPGTQSIQTNRTAGTSKSSSGSGKKEMSISGDDYVFSLNANYQSYPELASYKNVIWKTVQPLSSDEEKAFESSVKQIGSNIELKCIDEEKLIYNMNYGSNSIKIEPILTDGGKKAKEQFAKMDKNYKAALEEHNNEVKRQIKIAQVAQKVYNVFSVMKLGIYNCDRFYSSPKAPGFFTLLKNGIELKQNIYAVLEKNEGVVALSAPYLQNGRYRIPSTDVAGFIHIDSEGLIYKKVHSDNGREKYDMKLESTGKFADREGELQSVLNSL